MSYYYSQLNKGAAAWTPPSAGTPQWWLDFSLASTLSPGSITDGTAITQVNDRGANGNNFTSPATSQPLYKTGIKNGLSVARFDGSNDYFTHTFGGNFTSFTIAFEIKITTYRRYDTILGSSNQPTSQLTFELGASNSFNYYITNVGDSTTSGANSEVDGTWYRLVSTYDGTTLKIFINNGTATTTSTSGRFIDAIVNIGNDNGAGFTAMTGDIGEAIGWNTVLGTADLASLDAYLVAKWGS